MKIKMIGDEMGEKKYNYLIEQWKSFKMKIDLDKKKLIDNCFEQYIESINNKTFSLENYGKPNDNDCSYFCNFMERTSSKIYGSARPGSMYNYGISYIADKDKYFIQPKLYDNSEKKGVKYKKEEKQEITIYDKTVAEEIFNEKIKTYLESFLKEESNNKDDIEVPINATHLLRKLKAMKDKNSLLFIYADEAIDMIYKFFITESLEKTNIEKNKEVTLELKKIFKDPDNKYDDIYMIKLSRFIWSIFGSTINLESKNMILHGAPGTGKTYSVKNTVKNIILQQGGSLDEQLVFTQFHPSYSYEDFIDGIKPSGIDKNENLKFELVNGKFKDLCKRATEKLQEERKKGIDELTKFFFIADEINRAELSRVFGELLICLEDDYRIDFDKNGKILNEESLIITQNSMLDNNPVYKQNNQNYFGVPINLYFIGTMNDIDRSVDSFDMALRRRFFWKEMRCDYSFIDSLTFNKNNEYTYICKKLNRYITGYKEYKRDGKLEKVFKVEKYDSLGLGTAFELGHAYFKDIRILNNKEISKLWESKIRPLLKEYLRTEYAQDIIEIKLEEAKKIFKL